MKRTNLGIARNMPDKKDAARIDSARLVFRVPSILPTLTSRNDARKISADTATKKLLSML